MRVLLVYPIFPPSFWSFEQAIALLGRKALLPPLSLVTVAAILPQDWEFKLVDRNIRAVEEQEWAWADMVMISGMIVQKEDLLEQIREARRRGKPVAVGGPYATALPQDCREAGASYLVLDEGELTIPLFLEALRRGETHGEFRAGAAKPDVTTTPIPRFDLLTLDDYSEMSLQFSRGCPFLCEFCDIIVLYGRRPRTKTPAQMLAELERLYELGWRRSIFVVDDNFIGNKKEVKGLLRELRGWMEAHDYPFSFVTEASVDLARDQELMDAMVACNFGTVFLGIETPDTDSLQTTRKNQNMRDPLAESVLKITRSGLRVSAGFIIGFDGEKAGAGQRIVDFVEATSIPTAVFSMLQALPDTALTKRLATEGRLLTEKPGDMNPTTLMNFVPTRPMDEIAQEFVDGFWKLYDPVKFLDRVFRHFMILKDAKYPKKKRSVKIKDPAHLKAFLTICWRQGVVRKTRWKFWHHFLHMLRHNRGGLVSYLSTCGHAEHFLAYREMVRKKIEKQLAHHHANTPPSREHLSAAAR